MRRGQERVLHMAIRTIYLSRDLHPHLYQLEWIQLCREISHEPIVHIHPEQLGERVVKELGELQCNLVP